MTYIRITLRILSLAGAIIFLAGFAMTFASTEHLESHARTYIESEVRERVSDRIDSFRGAGSNRLLKALSSQYEDRISELETELETGIEKRVSRIAALMRNPSCECRAWLEKNYREQLGKEILLERDKAEVVRTLIMAGYGEVVDRLRADFRIFTLSSFFAFLLVLLTSFLKPLGGPHLLLPASLLIPSTLIAAWFYLFEQNWFYTILTNSYVGFGYTAFLLVIFGFLLDILFNRGRVCCKIINGLASSVSASFSVMPC